MTCGIHVDNNLCPFLSILKFFRVVTSEIGTLGRLAVQLPVPTV